MAGEMAGAMVAVGEEISDEQSAFYQRVRADALLYYAQLSDAKKRTSAFRIGVQI